MMGLPQNNSPSSERARTTVPEVRHRRHLPPIVRIERYRSAAVIRLGPVWDHTSCAMLNDLRVHDRHASRRQRENRRRPGKMRYRYSLGVKWSQVRILSPLLMPARPDQGKLLESYLSSDRAGIRSSRIVTGAGWCKRIHGRSSLLRSLQQRALPFGSGEQFIEGHDLRLVKIATI